MRARARSGPKRCAEIHVEFWPPAKIRVVPVFTQAQGGASIDVRVIGHDGQQVGVIDLAAAINLARQAGVDLVEIAPNAVPPVCRIIDYGKFKYELSKKERDSKKHQHTNTVKEVQLSPRIDPHDLGIKLEHAIGFLCEDMKVKATLRFRGRVRANTEIGKEVM
jgi:translation initiation factor IF-3